MTADPAHTILRRAYDLDGPNLDRQAQRLGADSWIALTAWLEIRVIDQGDGCSMLAADLPSGRLLEITDGRACLPSSTETFWIGIADGDGHEEYGLHVS